MTKTCFTMNDTSNNPKYHDFAEGIFISHIRPDEVIQSNASHQNGVADLASEFARDFGMEDFGRIMGLLHDKGKEQIEWQRYIRSVNGYGNDSAQINSGPHHAYVGACIACKQYQSISPVIAQPIAGHHRGLYDHCDFIEATKKGIPHEITIDEAIPCAMPSISNLKHYDYHHLVRMLFSCLVDADSLDTERFMLTEQANLRGNHSTLEVLLEKLEVHLRHLRVIAEDNNVNRIRDYVQELCITESKEEKGFYSLTVPTGGGKTLASVLWALHHAVKNGLKRIIIAIPYTSIIAQTAATLKHIFGEDNVLEHHSNVNPESIINEQLRERLQLATENWDYPIIVTTNVQLFESLFSNKRSDCRKLHNIVKSVIILDEVQTLPLGFLKPIVHSLDTLQRVFGTSILFTTASQPILCGRILGANPWASFDALPSVHEIIPAEAQLHDKLRRVELHFMDGARSYHEIAEELSQYSKVLCIVNTRRDAKEIYDLLPKEGICLHLSRMMCPAHVSATIQKIKEALQAQIDRPIRVIATQLIEAGVDIDFPVVFRQEAGLDSILQAAGRCNREGKQKLGTTYVFSLGKEHPLPVGHITQTNNARINMGRQMDWFAPDSMTKYFKQLHSRVNNFDDKQIQDLLYKPECEFEEAAHQFHLIDDQSIPVIVTWNESSSLYKQLISYGPSYHLMKKLAQFSVNVRERDFNLLKSIGAIDEPFDGIYAISDHGFYKADTGLSLENQWLEETFII